MADSDEPRMVPAPCAACGKPPFAGYETPDGRRYNLCFEHHHQQEELHLRQAEMYRQMAEQAEDDIADVMGMPRKVRPQRIPAARVNVQQITIQGNNLGVVNTGTVETIANNVTAINQADPALAQQLRLLAEAILTSNDLTDDDKREAADLLNEVVADATKDPAQRSSRVVMKAVASGLGQVLSKAAQLAAIWKVIEPHLPK